MSCTFPAKLLLAVATAATLAATAAAAQPLRRASVPPPSCSAVTQQTCATAQALGRGINLGNMLEAPREGDWGVRLEPAYVDKVAGAFNTVRVPVRWSNHAALTADARLDEAFAKLRLPPDRNIIVSIHNYDPFDFTHQGVEHLARPFPLGTTCCDAAQRKAITDALETARNWSAANGYPLHLGEFGTYEKVDMPSRVAYTRFVRDEAERRGIPWTLWEFASEFGVWSPKTGEWIEPLRRALLD